MSSLRDAMYNEHLLEILSISKEPDTKDIPEHLTDVLKALHIQASTADQIEREDRINITLLAIHNGIGIERVVEHLTWKDFEGFVARVLEENDFRCTESFRRRGTNLVEGMEIDVIGIKGNTLLAIDAKMWGIRSGKSSALREAARKQSIRTERLGDELERLSKKIPAMKPGRYLLKPIMVTWLVEEVEFHEGVPVVPIFKLNAFLLELARFDDFVVTFEGTLDRQLQQTKL